MKCNDYLIDQKVWIFFANQVEMSINECTEPSRSVKQWKKQRTHETKYPLFLQNASQELELLSPNIQMK